VADPESPVGLEEMMDALHNPSHPVWGLARVVFVLVALTVTLTISASEFDITELQTIGVMFAAVAGAEWLPKLLPRKSEEGK
jgi:hypothetical protein